MAVDKSKKHLLAIGSLSTYSGLQLSPVSCSSLSTYSGLQLSPVSCSSLSTYSGLQLSPVSYRFTQYLQWPSVVTC